MLPCNASICCLRLANYDVRDLGRSTLEAHALDELRPRVVWHVQYTDLATVVFDKFKYESGSLSMTM